MSILYNSSLVYYSSDKYTYTGELVLDTQGVNMDSIIVEVNAHANPIANLIRNFVSADNQTKITNGDPVRMNIILQAPTGNAAPVYFGSQTRQQAFITAGNNIPLLNKINVQETYIRGTAGDNIIIIIVE